jgi:hypothetical protein
VSLIAEYDLDPGCKLCRQALKYHADMGHEEAAALVPLWDTSPLNPPSDKKHRPFGGTDRKNRKH